jgi:death on curing protein
LRVRGFPVGGSVGIRDSGLLRPALAMPETSFDGEYLHPSLFEMAGAYLFHLARNHPFVDGNKHTALMCAWVFLGLNGQGLLRYRPRSSARAGAIDQR